ncbi:hypothetical protein [Methylobacterium nigriterrae]|uniref:hypothetical protein n=1 Tax=Methylobacterium nigriterrae TaxID=3127512 RepID=UPI003013D7BB
MATNSRSAVSVDQVKSLTPNGTYAAGDTITLAVDYHSAIKVSGTPELSLNSGGTADFSGYGHNHTELLFTYVVQPGDYAADLDVIGYAPGSTGSVTSPLGKPTLFAPGASHTLAANADLLIDAKISPTPTFTYLTGVSDPSNGSSVDPAISGDGHFVAFSSRATNLVPGQTDLNGSGSDIFVYDAVAKTTTNITNDAKGGSFNPAISADGHSVTFFSDATNLVPGQTDLNGSVLDIFVYDAVAKTTTNITNDAEGGLHGLGSADPAISADGHSVTFWSTATNLVPGQTDLNGSVLDIFLYDAVAKTTTNITNGANGGNFQPAISADGHSVTFFSNAMNLVPGQTDLNGSGSDIFVYDAVAKTTTNITNGANGESRDPAISADGHSVTFFSDATNLVPGQTDLNGATQDIFVYDAVAKTTTNITNGANGYSSAPAISADGHYVAFSSNATNLVPGQTDLNGATWDIFVYDAVAKTITNITNDAKGGSFNPAISADGHSVVFATHAANLDGTSHVSNGQTDIVLWHI